MPVVANSPRLRSPPITGARLNSLGKNAGEVALIGEACGQSDLAQGLAGVKNELLCPFHTLCQQPLVWWTSDGLLEGLTEVARR